MKKILCATLIFGSLTGYACVQKGVIDSITVNDNYSWYNLTNGFTLRLVHRSNLNSLLFTAASTGSEICVTEMNLDSTGPTWGIPRQISITKNKKD